jgi:hypothetical protein
MARSRAGSAMRTHCPTKSETSAGAPTAHCMPHHDDLSDLESLHREFDCGANPVRLIVRSVGRHKIGDIADDEELARSRIKHHLRIGPAVRTADHQRARLLSEFTQRIEAGALVAPSAGAKAAVAGDEIFHIGRDPDFRFARSFARDIKRCNKDRGPRIVG